MVANTATVRKPIAFYAHLGDVYGVALRASDNTVHFQADATGSWQTLANADRPRLHLHGEIAVVQAAVLADTQRGGAARIATTRLQEVA